MLSEKHFRSSGNGNGNGSGNDNGKLMSNEKHFQSSGNAAPNLYDGQVKLKEGEVAWAKNAYIVHQDTNLVLMIMVMMGITVMEIMVMGINVIWMGLGIMVIWMGLGIMVIIRQLKRITSTCSSLSLLTITGRTETSVKSA